MVNRIWPAAPADLITARPVKSNHLNRAWPSEVVQRSLKATHRAKFKETEEQVRKKVLTYISLERVKKPFPRIWDLNNSEITHKWRKTWNGGKRGIHWRVKSKICYWPERIQRVVLNHGKEIPKSWFHSSGCEQKHFVTHPSDFLRLERMRKKINILGFA